MKTIKKLIAALTTREMISYLIFGVLTTVVSLVSFNICTDFLSIHYIAANIVSWIISVTFAYIVNKLFVFNSKSWKMEIVVKEVVAFASARIASLLFETGFIAFCVELLHLPKFPSKLVASVFVVIINYVASKLFIFKNK